MNLYDVVDSTQKLYFNVNERWYMRKFCITLCLLLCSSFIVHAGELLNNLSLISDDTKQVYGIGGWQKEYENSKYVSQSQDANYYFELGWHAFYMDDYELAISYYTKVIKLAPYYAIAYNNRGSAYYFLGNYNQAIADFNKAIELDPNYADAYFCRAYVYVDLGNYNQAIADLTKATELDPNDAFACGIDRP